MKILILSPHGNALLPTLRRYDDVLVFAEDAISLDFLKSERFDLGLSYGFRHILKPEMLKICRFINLHISYLPWNRGADPNLWSWIEDSPKGVTIHQIDAGIDTGDILVQQFVEMREHETLKTSYEKLSGALISLFDEHWGQLRLGTLPPCKQVGPGSVHRRRDGERILQDLKLRFDTPVSLLKGIARTFES